MTAALAGIPASAQGAAEQSRIFQDDRQLLYRGPEARDAALDLVKSLGVDTIRVQFVWRNISTGRRPRNPADPKAYGAGFAAWDALLLAAQARGLRVLATVTGPAPAYAAGATKGFQGSRYPKPREFRHFMTAVGRRYSGTFKTSSASASQICVPGVPLPGCPTSPPPPPVPPPPPPPSTDPGGDSAPPPSEPPPKPPPPPSGTDLPRVGLWSVYNEPNHPLFLSPQRRRGKLVSPSLYRELYRAGHAGLSASGHGADTILIGETLPIGSNANRETAATSPLLFLRELFCLDARWKRLRGRAAKQHLGCSGKFKKLQASGWAVHPYYRKTGPFSRPPGPLDITPATLGRLNIALKRAGARGRLTRGIGIWDTENGSQTKPDPKGTSPSRQARFINEAEYLSWSHRFMRSFCQYLLTDERETWAFQSGLRFENGRDKPALKAYRLPVFVSRRSANKVTVWGRIPPGGSRTVTIDASKAPDVTVPVTSPTGYFTRTLTGSLAVKSTYLLRYDGHTSRRAAPSSPR